MIVINQKYKKFIYSCLLVSSSYSYAGLSDELESAFVGMSNYTPPDTYTNGTHRGSIYLGGFQERNPIMKEKLVTWSPPSARGGCGGIDVDLGGMSWLGEDKVIELMRAIAQNGKGYLFQMALSTISAKMSQWTESFRKSLDFMNQANLDSCQIAQGVVNDSMSAMGMKGDTDASLIGSAQGLYDDYREATRTSATNSTQKNLEDHDPDIAKTVKGNIVWKELKAQGVNTWFTSGDNDMLMALMSVSGTLVIGELADSTSTADADNAQSRPLSTFGGNILPLKKLIEGSSDDIEIYNCGTQVVGCNLAEPATGESNKKVLTDFIGLKTRIHRMLAGEEHIDTSGRLITATPGGVIKKYSTNVGSISNAERAMLSTLPGGTGGMLRNLSRMDAYTADGFASEAAGAIATQMAYQMITDMMDSVGKSMATSDSHYKTQLKDLFKTSREKLRDEYAQSLEKYGSVSDILEKYDLLKSSIDRSSLAIQLMKGM